MSPFMGRYDNEAIEEASKMNDMLEHDKDEDYSYAAIEQLIEKYLVRNRATKEI